MSEFTSSLKTIRSNENFALLKKKASLHRSASESSNSSPIIRAQEAWSFMQRETVIHKIHHGKRQSKKMYLNEDKTKILWKPTKREGCLDVSVITEVIPGNLIGGFKHKNVSQFCQDDSCCFTLKISNRDPMYLVAMTTEAASLWITGISALINFRRKTSLLVTGKDRDEERDVFLKTAFDAEALSADKRLKHDEVIKLFEKLNDNISSELVKQTLKEMIVDKNSEQTITCDDFVQLYKRLSTRPEMYHLLVQYASNNSYLTTDDLLLFLEQEQGLKRVTKDQCLDMIYRYELSENHKQRGQIGIDGFTRYLMSKECDIFDQAEHGQVRESEMHEPINQYFIASSHNTYLAQGQLYGKSDIQQYMDVLKKGCRCIELDCWDSMKGPIITHGGTVTSSLMFEEVIKTIEQFAFVTSKYPLVLSIENHCSVEQQRTMAKIMADVFEDKLCSDYLDDDDITELPSPTQLKEKILVKNKKLPKTTNSKSKSDGLVSDDDEDSGSETKKKKEEKGQKSHILAKELSDQVIYFAAKRFKDFQTSAEKQEPYEMCSLAEKRAEKLIKDSPEELVNYNKKFISRIYPAGTRVNSSNFNPHQFWNVGCQMVALNYQTSCVEMDLNNGMFLKNGECGYVLKPMILRDKFNYFNPNSTSHSLTGFDADAQIIKIKVVSGQYFSRCKNWADSEPVVVSVTVTGLPRDSASQKTEKASHDGYTTLFHDAMEFQVNLTSLALVRFEVKSIPILGDKKFLGQYTIPFDCIKTGYRHISLRDEAGKVIDKCSLFVHVAISNKRGGGEVNRGKTRDQTAPRNYPSMKSVGVKDIDETFKIAIKPLREASNLILDYTESLTEFKERCGLSPIASIKQCVRFLATRVNSTVLHGALHLYQCEDNQIYSLLEADGALPSKLESIINFFNLKFMDSCRDLIGSGNKAYERLLHCMRAGLEWYEELEDVCHHSGMKDKKFSKAMKNFGWNINLLQGQAKLLQHNKKECYEYLLQIQDTALTAGLMKTEDNEETSSTNL